MVMGSPAAATLAATSCASEADRSRGSWQVPSRECRSTLVDGNDATTGSIRPHVLVHAEEIRRVVLALEGDQAVVVFAVGGADAVGAVIAVEEVHVGCLGDLRLRGR